VRSGLPDRLQGHRRLPTGSLGILAEALHSGLDLVAAVMTYAAVPIAHRPPDASHLYGHGNVESFSALFEMGLLVATCVWIIFEAVKRLVFVEVEVLPSLWAFVVMATSIGVGSRPSLPRRLNMG
jgi:cation diffusion facilitator family transporter